MVSVIIPCYNVEGSIDRTLDSVKNQTYEQIELLCVDDGSTDRTLDRLRSREKDIPFLKIVQQENAGAPAARNKGLELASGKYLQFLDGDDELLPSKIEQQVKLIEKTKADFVVGAYTHEDGRDIPIDENPWKGLFLSRLGYTCSNLFRSESVRQVNGWDVTVKSSQEYDLMFRLLKAGARLAVDDEPLTRKHFRGGEQISKAKPLENWIRYWSLRSLIYDHIRSEKPQVFQEIEQQLNDEVFAIFRSIAKYDLDKAVNLKLKHLPDYKPNVSPVNSKLYVFLYMLLGFRNAERIKRLMK